MNRELFASADADMTGNLSANAQKLENAELSDLMERVSANLTAYESPPQFSVNKKRRNHFYLKKFKKISDIKTGEFPYGK